MKETGTMTKRALGHAHRSGGMLLPDFRKLHHGAMRLTCLPSPRPRIKEDLAGIMQGECATADLVAFLHYQLSRNIHRYRRHRLVVS